ncbi:MAG: methyl-accepting chemotaxis protein [Bacteroidota bacterium]
MKVISQQSFKVKLILAFVAVGALPLLMITVLVEGWMAPEMKGEIGNEFEIIAHNMIDKVERSLFERYGDVQAFAANEAVKDQLSWYELGSDRGNKIAQVMNTYSELYGIYPLMLAVDRQGKVIACSDKNAQGEPIDTKSFYNKNYKDTPWFQGVMNKNFLSSESVNGTFVQDVYVDEDVKQITGGSGLVVGFSAPIFDSQGKIIGVWNNRADFGLVEEIYSSTYKKLKKKGFGTTELTMLDKEGRVIVDYDPSVRGGDEKIYHDMSVLLKLNLAEKGVESAQALTRGEIGSAESFHARKKIMQVAGYAASEGALGYPGLGWGALARVSVDEAYATIDQILWLKRIVIVLAILGLAITAYFVANSLAKPINVGLAEMDAIGTEVKRAAEQVSESSNSLATGASEQAASVEESSASLEEISSLSKRNDENIQASANLAKETNQSAEAGLRELTALNETLESMKSIVSDMEMSVKDMQDSGKQVAKIVGTIDEIAFQTNILALNAAVEAARAGEAGMGFAVVADEVRTLAQRSADSAKETALEVEQSLQKGEEGTAATLKVVASIGDMEQKAMEVQEGFKSVLDKAKQVDNIMAEISTASQEQQTGLDQINTGVNEINNVTQANAAHAEETASASNELLSQAASLKDTLQTIQKLIQGKNAGKLNSGQQNKATESNESSSQDAYALENGGNANRSASSYSPEPTPQRSSAPVAEPSPDEFF